MRCLLRRGNQFVAELSSTEGVRQGDPFAALAFALTVQPLYEAAIATIKSSGGNGVAIQDDLAAVATWCEVLKVFDYVRAHAHEYGLKLRVDKCELHLPPDTARGPGCADRLKEIQAACNERDLPITYRSESLGVMHGEDKDISHYCEDAVDASEEFFQALEHPESMLLLRYCAIPRLGYLSRTTHPDRLRSAAQRFHERALSGFQRIAHITEEELCALDQGEIEHKEDGAPVSAVTREQLILRASLPIRLGALGLRPVSRILTAAYYSALVAALPALLRMCPDLRSAGDGPEDHSQQIRATELYAELADLRAVLLSSGAFNRSQRRQLAHDVAAEDALLMALQMRNRRIHHSLSHWCSHNLYLPQSLSLVLLPLMLPPPPRVRPPSPSCIRTPTHSGRPPASSHRAVSTRRRASLCRPSTCSRRSLRRWSCIFTSRLMPLSVPISRRS
jgi:hypothetical protein